jgi:hypothetical protein
MVTLIGVRIPIVGCVGVTYHAPSRSSDEGKEYEPGTFHVLRYKGKHGVLLVTEGGGRRRMARNHGWPAIFADGVPTPWVTSFAASKSFSRSIDVIEAHDMTLVGGASFNGGIFLVAAVVDRALKGSMVGERMNKSFGREVWEKEMSW